MFGFNKGNLSKPTIKKVRKELEYPLEADGFYDVDDRDDLKISERRTAQARFHRFNGRSF